MFLETFGKLRQKVIWKWVISPEDSVPDNVLVTDWLPQQQLLGHSNTKVFITHAGQSSFQETLCHQKPVVAIPVCGDQPVNANEAERLGFGISQPYGSLDETDLYNALDKVLHDMIQSIRTLPND